MKKGTYVVVTTKHRGVFGGQFQSREGDEVVLSDARVCVYWSANVKGFVGLAATGPLSGSKISDACPRMTLRDVTAILECSEAAEKQWEAGKWS